jgi:HSP20 family protein
MSIFKRDPWEKEFNRLWREVNELFEDMIGVRARSRGLRRELSCLKERLSQAFAGFKQRLGWNNSERELIIPAVDILEDDERCQLRLDIPGVKRSNLAVRLSGRKLSIMGRGKVSRNRRNILNQEIEYGDYYRVFELPREVDPDDIQAKLENGLLTINIPRAGQVREVEVIS